MPNFITLTCLSCGGKLEITNEIDRFACAYCGTKQIVNRGGGIISLKPVVEELQKIREGTDKSASELAISRLKNDLSVLQKEVLRQSQTKLMLLPIGRHLRYGLQKIRKLNFWNVGLASDQHLSEIIRELTLADINKLIEYFENRRTITTWLENFRNIVVQIEEKKDQIKAHQKVVG